MPFNLWGRGIPLLPRTGGAWRDYSEVSQHFGHSWTMAHLQRTAVPCPELMHCLYNDLAVEVRDVRGGLHQNNLPSAITRE